MFDVDNIEVTDLEEVSKILTNMCQEDIDVLNIQGCHPKSFTMHCFPIIPTCTRTFLTNKNECFDDDLTCQLSEIIRPTIWWKNSFLWVWSLMQTTFKALFFASPHFCITTTGKKEQVFCLGPCIRGDKWYTEEKRRTHQETFMWKKGKPRGKNCVRRRRLFEDQSSWNPQRHL